MWKNAVNSKAKVTFYLQTFHCLIRIKGFFIVGFIPFNAGDRIIKHQTSTDGNHIG